jgi:dihydroneopterin aldolase
MAIIALEGMRFHAFHGFYEEERIIGNEFILDVLVNTDISMASMSDELYVGMPGGPQKAATVNYETIYLLCKAEMSQPTKLLETLVDRIAERISDHFSNVTGTLVRLRKLSPPLGGRVDSSWLLTTHGDIDVSYLNFVK